MYIKKSLLFSLFFSLLSTISNATIHNVDIANPQQWRVYEMFKYVGDTVLFDCPMYVINNYYSGQLTIAPQRLYSPTNQCMPGSQDMLNMQAMNSYTTASLNSISDYHRIAEQIDGLKVKVLSSDSWQYISADRWTGMREHVMVPPSVDGDSIHNLLVCVWNLEYYLAENFGTGFGPDNLEQHKRQQTKILKALRKINADIYGFCEIEQGQSALKELSDSLGNNYTYINDGGVPFSSYVKVGYVYDSTKVEVVGLLQNIDSYYQHRKKMITFREKSSGESFILSLNHFKAKSGTATGADVDKGDGQGVFNFTRTKEAEAVLSAYEQYSKKIDEADLLVMGDLNAYAMEDPITTFTSNGYIDLHRFFHADTSYTYAFRGLLGYLDHAIANQSMAKQVTGMAAWHINSPESDDFTYDKSDDLTMFRASDHDPVLVGLRLRHVNTGINPTIVNNAAVLYDDRQPVIFDAENAYYRLYNVSGILLQQGLITTNRFEINNLSSGYYLLDVFKNGGREQFKIIVK